MLPFLSSGKSTPNLELPILISWNMQQLRMVQAATFRVCYRTCQDGKSESITLHELQRFNSVNLFQATETNKNFETTTGILWKVALKDNEGFLCSSIQSCHTLHFHKKRLAIAHCEAMRSWPKPQELPALEQMYSLCLACIPNETNIDSFDALKSKQSIRSTRNKQSSEKASPYSLNSTPLLQGHSILSWDPHKGYPSAEW